MAVGWYVGAIINVGASIAINLGTVRSPPPCTYAGPLNTDLPLIPSERLIGLHDRTSMNRRRMIPPPFDAQNLMKLGHNKRSQLDVPEEKKPRI